MGCFSLVPVGSRAVEPLFSFLVVFFVNEVNRVDGSVWVTEELETGGWRQHFSLRSGSQKYCSTLNNLNISV